MEDTDGKAQEMTDRDVIPPAAVIFDMDGVLVDTEPLHARCYVGIFRQRGLKCTVDAYRRLVTCGDMDVREVYTSIGGDMAEWPQVMSEKAAQMCEELKSDWEPMPGVVELLQELQLARVPAAVVTAAGARSMGILLDRFDLRKYFSGFVTWQDVTATKPDPEGFLTAAERLGVDPRTCVVIEDSPRGVTAASRAGMKCVAAPTESTADADFSLATVVVASLQDVRLKTLRSLFHGGDV